MKLLSLDTSSVACTVAVDVDGAVTEQHEEQPREHTRILLPMIRAVLAKAGVALQDLDAIVLGNGPGSFIGMRIAASVAQGLAHGGGLQIAPISSLAAVAAQVFAESDADEVIVTQDAHMHEVYLGMFRRDENGLPVAIGPERLSGQESIPELAGQTEGLRLAAGFGWHRYPELLASNRERIHDVAEVLHPRARYLLALGAAGIRDGNLIQPRSVSPAYLRQKVAQKAAPSP